MQLTVAGVCKQFGTERQPVHVLDDVNMSLTAPQSLAITGPSGSGKSTLLHLLGSLDEPDSGTIEFNGQNPFVLTDRELARFRNESVGFVFQDHHLLPQYTALENTLLPTLAFGTSNAALTRRAQELLERVGLGARAAHRPAALSGGECQRVAVARALINNPGAVLCDEPTGNLDQRTAESVADLLFGLHEEESNILVVVTHSAELAARCQQTIELKDGRCVLKDGPCA